MPDNDLAQQIENVRAHTNQLVAQLGADPDHAAPLLQAVAALEQQLLPAPAALHTNADQHSQFLQLLTEVPTGVAILSGQELRYTFTNPIYNQIAGRTDMVGKTLRELYPELEGQGIHEILDGVYTTGVAFITSEIMIQLDRDGDGIPEDIYYDLSYRPLRAADGTITGVIVYALDIGDRRALEQERARVLQLTQQAQQAVEAERERLLRILHQASAAICTTEGPQHVFTFTNPRYDQLVGQTGLLGKTVRVGLPEIEGQGYFEMLDNVYSSGVAAIGNEVLIQFDRQHTGTLEQAFVNFIYAPLRDTNGVITGVFVHAVDVTELVAARQAAEAAVVVRDQFLSIAAHELKTPLTTILGYVQVLQYRMRRAGTVDDRTERTLTMIGAQGQRLTRLIDTLMDVARINQGHLSLERAPLDLASLVARIIDELSVILHNRPIEVTLAARSCMVSGDSLRLEQVIVNLVQNAAKYSPQGGVITVTVDCDATQARVIIRDSGIGIPAAALPRVFERYYRVLDGAASLQPGMGIGLSVVKEIVALHGGTVSVESTEGEGSTFTVSLPLL